MYRFILLSDLHYGVFHQNIKHPEYSEPFLNKRLNIEKIKKMIQNGEEKIDYITVAGDITDNGDDGGETCGCCVPCCGNSKRLVTKSCYNELDMFINAFEKPLGHLSILVPGNHDLQMGGGRFGLHNYIQDKISKNPKVRNIFRRDPWIWEPTHVSLFYTFDVSDKLMMICCGMYPDSHMLSHLENALKECIDLNKNAIIMYHYHFHTTDGDEGNMPVADQKVFLDLCKKYKNNIVCILTGHEHLTITKGINLENDNLNIRVLNNYEEIQENEVLDIVCGGYSDFWILEIDTTKTGKKCVSKLIKNSLLPEENIKYNPEKQQVDDFENLQYF